MTEPEPKKNKVQDRKLPSESRLGVDPFISPHPDNTGDVWTYMMGIYGRQKNLGIYDALQCTGGCSSDKKLYKDIYEYEIRQQAVQLNLNIADPLQRRIAHMSILQQFRHKYNDNKTYLKQDKEGPPVALGPEFTVRDGGIYYDKFGKSLQQMYEDQRLIRPHEYDPKEHATMTMVEQAIVAGAKVVSHVGHNKDEKGDESIRDQIILRWDPVTKKGSMEIRNIAPDGNFHSIETALDIIRDTMPGMAEIHLLEGVAIFSDTPITTERIFSIDSSDQADRQVVEDSHITHTGVSELVVANTADTMEYVADRIRDDIREFISVIKDRMGEQQNIIIPQFLHRLLRVSEQEKKGDRSSVVLMLHLFDKTEKILRFNSEERMGNVENNKEVIVIWKKRVQQELDISSAQSQELLEKVYEMHEVMEHANDVVTLAVDTGVGIGAALFALDVLVTLDPTPVDTIEETRMPIEIPPILEEKDGQSVVTTEALERIFIRILEEQAQDIALPELQQQVDIVVVGWLQEFIHTLDQKTPEEATILVEKEQESVLTKLEQLQEALNLQGETLEPRIGRIGIEQKAVQEFSLAVTAWTMLRLFSYYETLCEIKTLFAHAASGSRTTEPFIPKEPSPWLLLAIIWHLAMVREHGVTTTQKKKKKKKQIYRSGLIYSYPVHGMISV